MTAKLHIRRLILYTGMIGFSIIFLFYIIGCTWIGYEVKATCRQAQTEYSGDCVEALSSLLLDNNRGFKLRNSAAWALGQLGDIRALPALQQQYTGFIPDREPLNEMISQYELQKAINLVNGGTNISAWLWRDQRLTGLQ